jgi:hypothetical protein
MRKLTLGILLATLLVPFGLAHGQERFDPREVQEAEQLLPILRSDLRNYVTAQEAFFADSIRYARRMRSLAQSEFGYRASRGVTVVMLTASDKAHSAIAIHEDLPDHVCAVYVGDTPPPLSDDTSEGEVTCRWPG